MLLLQKNKIFIVILLLLSLPAVFSIFHQGFFLSDDGNWMVVRFSAFYEALRSGQFPVRFLSRLNFGYGYPVADFLYPLFMYIGIPIHILGANFVTTVKIIFGMSLIISGIGAFFWLKKLVRNSAALVGSLIYLFFPYHIFDVYQRGSIGEALALAIVPFILWQAERKKIVYTALLLSCLILAHNSLAVLFLPFLFGYFLIRKLFLFRQLTLLIIISLASSAFFWIPALYDKQYTIFDVVKVSSLQSYFLSGSTYFLLGWISLISLLLALPFLFVRRNMTFIYFFLLSLFSVFMAFPISNVVWNITRITPFFQFPYRFLSLTVLGISFLGAMIIDMLPKKFYVVVAILLTITIYYSSWNLLFPKIFQYYPDSFYSTNQDSTTVKNEYMPKWVKVFPLKQPDEKIFADDKSAVIKVSQNKGSKIVFNITTVKETNVFINTIDFPGWKVVVDGKETLTSHENERGIIAFSVPRGRHSVIVVFTETPVRLFADALSLATLLVIVYMLIWKKYER